MLQKNYDISFDVWCFFLLFFLFSSQFFRIEEKKMRLSVIQCGMFLFFHYTVHHLSVENCLILNEHSRIQWFIIHAFWCAYQWANVKGIFQSAMNPICPWIYDLPSMNRFFFFNASTRIIGLNTKKHAIPSMPEKKKICGKLTDFVSLSVWVLKILFGLT